MKEFILKHWKKFLVILLLILLYLGLSHLVRQSSDHSIIIGHPDNIIVISPEESQDVIVIGDPEKVKVTPKNKK